MAIRLFKPSATSGNLTGVAAATTVGGPTVRTRLIEKGALSCLLSVLAETDTLTIRPVWQVSDDDSTWKTLVEPSGALPAGWATGTTAADAAVERQVSCPVAAWSSRFVRMAIVTGGTTGGTADLYSFTMRGKYSADPES